MPHLELTFLHSATADGYSARRPLSARILIPFHRRVSMIAHPAFNSDPKIASKQRPIA